MSRQRKNRGFPAWVLLLVIVLAGAAGFVALRHGEGDASLRTVETLEPDLYYGNANSLRGNTYRIDAEIGSALGNSPAKGRLFSVILGGGKGGKQDILPVLMPPALGSLTVQKGQHYVMKVKVGDDGLLIVEEARKP